MARTLNKLNTKKVERTREPGLYSDGGGLYLRVAPGRSRGWIVRYKLHGRQHDLGLGGYPAVGLADAREKAADVRKLLASGADPIDERAQRRQAEPVQRQKAMTLRDCAEAYLRSRAPGWRGGKREIQWLSILSRHAYPMIGDLPVAALDTPAIMGV